MRNEKEENGEGMESEFRLYIPRMDDQGMLSFFLFFHYSSGAKKMNIEKRHWKSMTCSCPMLIFDLLRTIRRSKINFHSSSHQVSPRGLLLDVTIIVMFHRLFLTKIDRSYHVECFYVQYDETVSQSYDVR